MPGSAPVFNSVSQGLKAPSGEDMANRPNLLHGSSCTASLLMALLWLAPCAIRADTFSMVYVSVFSENLEMTRPAIDMAVEQFMADGGLQGHQVKYYMIQTSQLCASELEAMDRIVPHLLNGTIDVLLGAACATIAAPASWTLHHWNIAIFSEGAISDDMGDKTRHPNLVRLNAPYDRMGPACVEIMKTFSWDRAALLSQNSELCEYGALSINDNFPLAGLILTEWIRYGADFTPGPAHLDQYLEKIRQRARIIWLCMEMSDVVQLMLRAHALGMTNGDFAFLYYGVDVGSQSFWEPWFYPVYRAHTLSEEQARLQKEAFYPFKQVTPAGINGQEIDDFRREVALRMRDDYNNSVSWDYYQAGWLWSIFLYDAVYLYLNLVNETLSEGGDPRNGSALFNKARNREFYGISGQVVMDDKADRDPDYVLYFNGPTWGIQTEGLLLTMSEDPGERVSFFDNGLYWGTDDNLPPPSVPRCGFQEELCPVDTTTRDTILTVTSTCLVIIALCAGILISWKRRMKLEQEIQQMLWRIQYEDISFASIKWTSMLRDMTHDNLNSFIGASVEAPNIYIVTQFCAKGTLQNLLENDEINLDWDFKYSLINDVVNGMIYIHGSFLHSHGHLGSHTCLVDSRWQVKISSFGLQAFRKDDGSEPQNEDKKYFDLLWTAPELLRIQPEERPFYGTQAGDVYSFAILTQEILCRTLPYFIGDENPKDIIEEIAQLDPEKCYRPDVPDNEKDVNSDMVLLMKACWEEVPEHRPTFYRVKNTLRAMNRGRNYNIMDNMIEKLEKYAGNLEQIVQQRTQQLIDEKKKTDSLLYKMLPRSVADVLKRGLSVVPEIFDEVTIYFSDIVGFTSVSSESTPIQVVDLLNDLYTLFDDVIECYNVYKVETIGDAYMVVSGLPERNGLQHAPEIASMSLHLLSAVYTQFRIRHRPNERLRLRIGLHTGPCAAGVVGLTMPRYCLFGDTVNMASRMESNGQPLRIHISQDSYAALKKSDVYVMIERGEMEIKGKGLQTTYWLIGKTDFSRPLPDFLQE